MPFAWHAAATISPASPPPAIRTRRGSARVTARPPAGTRRGSRHQAALSSAPAGATMLRASTIASLARLRTRSTRSADSATRLGARGSSSTLRT